MNDKKSEEANNEVQEKKVYSTPEIKEYGDLVVVTQDSDIDIMCHSHWSH